MNIRKTVFRGTLLTAGVTGLISAHWDMWGGDHYWWITMLTGVVLIFISQIE